MVKSTFILNFKNLFSHYTSFDKTYLINSAADENGLKVAFAKNKLSYLKSNDDTFLTAFREVAAERGYLNSEAQRIPQANKNYTHPKFNPP